MSENKPWPLATFTLLLASCQTYDPEPVDLPAHARAWAERLPESESVAQFVQALAARTGAAPTFDAKDGIDAGEARLLALLFHPDLMQARAAAEVARAGRDHAGLWPDPELRLDASRILADVEHQWLAGAEIGITLPITGRPGLEVALADAGLAAALLEVRAAEAAVLDRVDAAFCEWSALQQETAQQAQLLEQLAALEAIARRLRQADEINAIDARVFTLERLRRELDRDRTAARAARAELALKQLLGLVPAAAVVFAPSLAPAGRAPWASERAAAVAADCPPVARAQAAHALAERKLQLAVRKQWPELTLFPKFESEDGQDRPGLGLSLPLPLWNGNAREIAEARAARTLAARALEGSYQRAIHELAAAEQQLQAASALRQGLEQRLVPLVDQQVADGRRLAELGQLDALLLLDGLQRAHDAKVQVLQARLDEARATIQLNSLFWPELAAPLPVEQAR